VGGTDVHVQKIDHGAKAQPVDQIADRPAENQSQGTGQQQIPGIAFDQIINNQTCRQNRDAGEENIAEGCGSVGQKSEGRSGIQDIDQIKKSGDDRLGFMQNKSGGNRGFGDLIQGDDRQRAQKEYQ